MQATPTSAGACNFWVGHPKSADTLTLKQTHPQNFLSWQGFDCKPSSTDPQAASLSSCYLSCRWRASLSRPGTKYGYTRDFPEQPAFRGARESPRPVKSCLQMILQMAFQQIHIPPATSALLKLLQDARLCPHLNERELHVHAALFAVPSRRPTNTDNSHVRYLGIGHAMMQATLERCPIRSQVHGNLSCKMRLGCASLHSSVFERNPLANMAFFSSSPAFTMKTAQGHRDVTF